MGRVTGAQLAPGWAKNHFISPSSPKGVCFGAFSLLIASENTLVGQHGTSEEAISNGANERGIPSAWPCKRLVLRSGRHPSELPLCSGPHDSLQNSKARVSRRREVAKLRMQILPHRPRTSASAVSSLQCQGGPGLSRTRTYRGSADCFQMRLRVWSHQTARASWDRGTTVYWPEFKVTWQ